MNASSQTQVNVDKNNEIKSVTVLNSQMMVVEEEEEEEEEKETPDGDIEIIEVSKHKPRKIPTPTWRECTQRAFEVYAYLLRGHIKKIWEVDPLKCPHCLGEMKIISFIKDRDVIRQILKHLNLWHIPKQPRPPPEKSLHYHNTIHARR